MHRDVWAKIRLANVKHQSMNVFNNPFIPTNTFVIKIYFKVEGVYFTQFISSADLIMYEHFDMAIM